VKVIAALFLHEPLYRLPSVESLQPILCSRSSQMSPNFATGELWAALNRCVGSKFSRRSFFSRASRLFNSFLSSSSSKPERERSIFGTLAVPLIAGPATPGQTNRISYFRRCSQAPCSMVRSVKPPGLSCNRACVQPIPLVSTDQHLIFPAGDDGIDQTKLLIACERL